MLYITLQHKIKENNHHMEIDRSGANRSPRELFHPGTDNNGFTVRPETGALLKRVRPPRNKNTHPPGELFHPGTDNNGFTVRPETGALLKRVRPPRNTPDKSHNAPIETNTPPKKSRTPTDEDKSDLDTLKNLDGLLEDLNPEGLEENTSETFKMYAQECREIIKQVQETFLQVPNTWEIRERTALVKSISAVEMALRAAVIGETQTLEDNRQTQIINETGRQITAQELPSNLSDSIPAHNPAFIKEMMRLAEDRMDDVKEYFSAYLIAIKVIEGIKAKREASSS